MEAWTAALWMGVALAMIWRVQCNEDIVSVISEIDDLNEDVFRLEERVLKKIDWAKISLRSELKQHISEHVREAIAGILQGESIEEMVRSQVITEVRQLRRGNHQMKRHLHHVLMSVNEVREEQRLCSEILQKTQRKTNEIDTCSKWMDDVKILEKDLERCESNTTHYREKAAQKDTEVAELKESLNMLNLSCQLHLKEINTASVFVQENRTTPPPVTDSTTSAPSPVSPATTIRPEETRGRIIIVPIWTPTQHQWLQLNIDSGSVSNYALRSLKRVGSVAYVSKLRKLLIGVGSPNKILCSNLDSYDVKTMRENVRVFGMAVDEEREIVFMTTEVPHHTISRMTTQGMHFTAMTDLKKYGGSPRAIAVNVKTRLIYACNGVKVFLVTYDGGILQTLATGSEMRAVTLDNTGDILYYNDKSKLMKMSLSRNDSKIVTTLSVRPWNIRYYMNSLYFSSYNAKTIGVVDVRYDIISYTLHTVKGFSYQSICLVP